MVVGAVVTGVLFTIGKSLISWYIGSSAVASSFGAAAVVPAETLDLLTTEISRIAAKSDGKLTFGFLLGLAIALWSANAGMKAIFDALNIIYDEQEKRGLIRLNVVSLFCTVCALAGIGVAFALVVIFPLILSALGLSSVDAPIHQRRCNVRLFHDIQTRAAKSRKQASTSRSSSPT